jgi:hypothetical protein
VGGVSGDRISAAEFREMQAKPKAPAQGPAAPKGKQQWALGRMPQGLMNKTEERFLAEYIAPFMAAGEIVWWCFEGFKLRLADNTFLTVDFALMRKNGEFELVDVKGCKAMIEDDAWVKLKVARDKFPFRFFVTWPLPKRSGWHFEEV